MRADTYLKTIVNANGIIKYKLEELRNLRYFSKNVASFSEKKEDVATTILHLEEEIESEMKSYFLLKEEAKSIIERVPDFEERMLLQLRYFGFLKWERIAMEMSCSVATIFRLHKKALCSLDCVLEDVDVEKYFQKSYVDSFDNALYGSIIL